MQQQQTSSSSPRMRRRGATRREFSPGTLTTAISAGLVLVLISVTFVADWLRTPDITLLSSSPLLSPNGDLDRDFTTVSYQLSQDAAVTARIFAPRGGLVRTLFLDDPQAAGQHTLSWDGLTELGQAVEDGQYRLEISARGTLRSSSKSLNLQVDSTPPNLQLANVPEGLRVRESAITIQGLTDPGASVWITGDPRPVAVDGQGNFSFLYRLTAGTNLLELRATDQAGNTTTIQRQVSLVAEPPELVVAAPADDSWTNQSLVAVSGRVTPGVSLQINDQAVQVAADGAFNHQLSLTAGDHLIRLAATDDVGNVTLQEILVHVKTSPPVLTLNVEEGEILHDPVLQLTGQTEPGAFVQVNGQVVPVGLAGGFQIGLQLSEGSNIIDIAVRDQAGNTTQLVRQLRYAPGGPAATSGLERLRQNLAVLPDLTIPVLLLAGILFAFFLFRQRGVAMTISVDPQTFSPGLPGEGKVMLIWLDINRDTRISLEVLDQHGYPMATILRDRRRTARKHTFSWDGYDDFGRPMPPGEYTLQAEAGVHPARVTTGVNIRIEEDILVHNRRGGRQVLGQMGMDTLPRSHQPGAGRRG